MASVDEQRIPADAPAPEHGDSPGIHQYLLILRRRWRLLILTWILVVGAAAVYTFTTSRLYRPQATLEIRPETPLLSSEMSADPALLSSRNLWESYYRTQQTILTSPSLHEEALKALPESIRKVYEAKIDPIQSFSQLVDLEEVRSSFIIKIGFIDPDPKVATQVTNTLVSLYLEEANRRLREMKTGAVELLSREALPAIKQGVDDAQKAVDQFISENSNLDPTEQYGGLVESRRTVLAKIEAVRLKQIEFRAQRDALKDYISDGSADVFNPAFYITKNMDLLMAQQEAAEAELSREIKNLKDDHPTIVELKDQIKRLRMKIRAVTLGTMESLATELIAAEAEEKAAKEELGLVEKDMAEVLQKVSKYKRVDLELVAARELYTSYLKKQGETQAISGVSLGSVRVIDHAEIPVTPYRPRIILNLGVAGLLGIMLGVGLMFVSEQLDDRILSPKEIEAFVGVNVLGIIPKLTAPAGEGEKPLVLGEHSTLPEFEAFRGLRAEVTTRLEGVSGCRMVAVLSALSAEGKSTVAVNLAKVLAMDGRRVLLFDADMRRPTVKRDHGNKGQAGLEAVLKGEAPLESAIQRGNIEGVDIIGMSLGTSHAAELAGSAAFDEIFKKVSASYDYVIVDSAPVIPASESPLIARRCTAAIMVVRERKTSRSVAQVAVRRLHGMGVTLLGTVLNGADPKGGGYGYGYYGYQSYYLSGKAEE